MTDEVLARRERRGNRGGPAVVVGDELALGPRAVRKRPGQKAGLVDLARFRDELLHYRVQYAMKLTQLSEDGARTCTRHCTWPCRPAQGRVRASTCYGGLIRTSFEQTRLALTSSRRSPWNQQVRSQTSGLSRGSHRCCCTQGVGGVGQGVIGVPLALDAALARGAVVRNEAESGSSVSHDYMRDVCLTNPL